MKNLFFLLLFSLTSSIFSKNTQASINFIDEVSFLKNRLTTIYNSASYEIKKANDNYKKSSFVKKIKYAEKKVFLNQITPNSKNVLLQTLSIKLDSVKQLHQKGLLKKDVLVNTNYYHNFLTELKGSVIISDEYLFLENALLKVSVVNTNKKYHSTIYISLFLSVLLIATLSFLFIQKKKTETIDLTNQELVIKKLITNGNTNKEIATELHISLNTVKTHVSNIYQKLKVSNRKDLILKS